MKSNLTTIKAIENALPFFEKDTEIYENIDTFLEKCTQSEEIREEVDLIHLLIEKIRNSKDSDTIMNSRKRLLRFLKRLPQFIGTTKLKNAQTVQVARSVHMSQVDTSIPVYTRDDYYNLLVTSQQNVENLGSNFEMLAMKRKKAQDLMEICESLALFTSKNLTIDVFLFIFLMVSKLLRRNCNKFWMDL